MIQMLSVNTDLMKLDVRSKSFNQNELIPKKHTCDGVNVSPSLDIAFLPNSTVSLAVVVDDPDAPINTWTHWLVWNLPPIHHIPEHCKMGNSGMNDFAKSFYCGPCPMNGLHNYRFKVYALNTKLNLTGRIRIHDFEKAIENHVVAYGELNGKYSR
jgi:Raf kinase inhibitor-like YbhB/YbcL family protein